MRDKDSAIAALDAEYQKKRSAIDTEYRVLYTLPEDLRALPFRFHAYPLYGSIGTLTLPYNRYTGYDKTEPHTLAVIDRLLDVFPQLIPGRLVKDGSTCLMPLPGVEADRERLERRDALIMKTSGCQIKIAPADYSRILTLEWYARNLSAGDLITIRVEYPLHGEIAQRIGSLDLKLDRARDVTIRVIRNKYTVADRIDVIGNSRARVISWAAGGVHPGDHTIYWESGNIDESDVTIAEVIARLRPIVTVRRDEPAPVPEGTLTARVPTPDTYTVYVDDQPKVVQESYTVAYGIARMVRDETPDHTELGDVARGILSGVARVRE